MYKLSIIVPAYDEELNLSKVIEGILFFVKSLSYSVEIIVVDDCSGDGTFNIATQYSKKYEMEHPKFTKKFWKRRKRRSNYHFY
jgi:glycosyltransferase involved in cell wall biosynthesis